MAITPTLTDIALASTLLLITIGVSAYLRLGLVGTLIMAGVRTVVQLSMIGLILAWVFARESEWQVLAILTVMTFIVSHSAKGQVKRPYKGLLSDSITSLSVATGVVTLIAMTLILKVSPPVHHTDFGADFGQFFDRYILDHQRTCERHARQASPYQISPIAVGHPL